MRGTKKDSTEMKADLLIMGESPLSLALLASSISGVGRPVTLEAEGGVLTVVSSFFCFTHCNKPGEGDFVCEDFEYDGDAELNPVIGVAEGTALLDN
ncbi:unnamed protein product [Boreogadus saida]